MLDSIISDSILSDIAEQESYKEIYFSKPIKSNYGVNKMHLFDEEFEDLAFKNKKNLISDDLDESNLTKEDYIQMALHYKTVCKSYKKQLIESQKTVKELRLAVEHLEKKNWNLKKQKSNESNENYRLLVEKCAIYCEKINQFSGDVTSDEDSACPNDRDYQETKDELITRTLQSVLKEKKDFKNFASQFKSLIETLNPTKETKLSEKPSFQSLNKAVTDTLKYTEANSIRKFQCKCFGFYDFNRVENLKKFTKTTLNSASSISSLNSGSMNSVDLEKAHKPSQEFLLKCLNLFQDLFDVDCFLNVPTKMNDIYYKYGQLVNFKKAIQNIFDKNENYPSEKLVCNVQNVYKLLNENISSNLKGLLNTANLEKVVDKFNMYDEYFPLFHKLLEKIMKALEISRLDQIMPSIRALKILATPSLC